MSDALLLVLFVTGILNDGPGPLPYGEPCRIVEPNPFSWLAFEWQGHRLRSVEQYSSEALRERTTLHWTGNRVDRIEQDTDADGTVDFVFQLEWERRRPVRITRTDAEGGSVTARDVDLRWTWSADGTTVRVTDRPSDPTYAARFDAQGRLLRLEREPPEARVLLVLTRGPDGRVRSEETAYARYEPRYDAAGRITERSEVAHRGDDAQRSWEPSSPYTERYEHTCPAR